MNNIDKFQNRSLFVVIIVALVERWCADTVQETKLRYNTLKMTRNEFATNATNISWKVWTQIKNKNNSLQIVNTK